MARLAESSQTTVGIVFLAMNLERWLSAPFLRLVKWFCLELQLLTEHRFSHAEYLMIAAWLSIESFSEL